jgi:hypothetical protein
MKRKKDIENKDKCPDCGRDIAKNIEDCAAGKCPKWWAYRDPAAENDCLAVVRKKQNNNVKLPIYQTK